MHVRLKSLLNEYLNEAKIKHLSPQEATDKKMFGPVFHGTSDASRQEIDKDGFKIFIGHARSGDIKNGYQISSYAMGMPAPVHHLGFGIYFTKSKSIAKNFNGGTTSGLKAYYLDIPRLETINWGSPNTMMKWWIENGYNFKVTPETSFGNPQTNLKLITQERFNATVSLTNHLKNKYDAVYYKGKVMYKLLDGDQICVFDPSKIYELNLKLAKAGEIGSKVIAARDIDKYNRGHIDVVKGTPGVITSCKHAENWKKDFPTAAWIGDSKHIYCVKWKKGGELCNLIDADVTPL